MKRNSSRSIKIGIGLSLYVAVLAAGMVFLRYALRFYISPEIEAELKVATVVKVPFNKQRGGKSGLRQVQLLDRFWAPHSDLAGLLPADVDAQGNILLLIGTELWIYNAQGQLIRKSQFAWLNEQTYGAYLRAGAGGTVWITGNIDRSDYDCLVKANRDGSAEWETGCPEVKNNGSKPPLPPPAKASAQQITLGIVGGLYAAENGDAFVIDNEQKMQRFAPDGEHIAEYPLRVRAGFSALATRTGTVYNWGDFEYAEDRIHIKGFRLLIWPTAKQYTTRILDPTSQLISNSIESQHVLLAGVDAAGNIYVQYMYDVPPPINGDFWRGAMAVAKINGEGRVEKIFDLYKHYQSEIAAAKKQAGAVRKQQGIIGLGDVIAVGPQGELYLEVANATHYRIDKISTTH